MEVEDFHEEISLNENFDPIGEVSRLFLLSCLAILLVVLSFILSYYAFIIGRLNYLDYKTRNSSFGANRQPWLLPDDQLSLEQFRTDDVVLTWSVSDAVAQVTNGSASALSNNLIRVDPHLRSGPDRSQTDPVEPWDFRFRFHRPPDD